MSNNKEAKEGSNVNESDKQLLQILKSTNRNRLVITSLVLTTFMLIMIGIGAALFTEAAMGSEWKEILLLVLGAFIASYGKIIDFWFQKQDTDTALIKAVDEPDIAPPVDGGCPCGCGCPSCSGGSTRTIGDADGDGIPNYIDTDSDGDGISDAEESKY